MKIVILVFACVMAFGVLGCGKTMGDIRADGAAIADTGSSIIKKAIDAGIAVYDIVRNIVDDVKDNVITVKDTVMGISTPVAPPSK